MSMVMRIQPWMRVVETEEARYLRFEMRDPDVGTLFNLMHHSLMIVKWVDRKAGLFVELGVVEKHYTPAMHAGAIRRVIKANSPEAFREVRACVEASRRAVRDGLQEAQDTADRHLEIREYLRRRTAEHMRDHPLWATL